MYIYIHICIHIHIYRISNLPNNSIGYILYPILLYIII